MTISIELLKQVRKIVSHENCPDGVSSAILCLDAIPSAEVVFVQHGTLAFKNLVAEPGMLFVDCVPPVDRVQEFVDAGTIVLDHHSGSVDVVRKFGLNGVFADAETEPGVSGASLAHTHVWKPLRSSYCYPETGERGRAELFAQLAGIRDTWQKKDPLWHDACCQAEALLFYPWEKWSSVSSPFHNSRFEEMLAIGSTLRTKHEAAVKDVVSKAWMTKSEKGTRMAVFQGVRYSSDAAELLGDSVDLVVAFSYAFEMDHKLILSSRSHAGYDCSAFARMWGGNGHRPAAGASMRFNATEPTHVVLPSHYNPYLAALECVNTYEKNMT